MNVIEKIEQAISVLDEIQDYNKNLNTMLSNIDMKISDLEHLIENNKIGTKGSYRIVRELKKCTIERRKIKNDMEISRTYETHINKLTNNTNRKMLITEIRKSKNKLNSPYQYRIYTEEELKELMGV